MINYLAESFVEDIVNRVYGWRLYYDKKSDSKRKRQLGLFATVSTWMPHCRNTGIYETGDLAHLHAHNEIMMLYPGFSWTEETIRQHTLDYLKDLQQEYRKQKMNEDFND